MSCHVCSIEVGYTGIEERERERKGKEKDLKVSARTHSSDSRYVIPAAI